MSPHPPAYLLWLGPTGLTIARSLGRAGVPVVALHHDPNEPSLDSRYARVQMMPPFERDEGAWLKFLLDEGRRLAPQRSVLISASDAHWLFVARHREALQRYFHFALPEGDPLSWLSKPWQYATAERVGVPFPRTFLPRDEADIRGLAKEVIFPCLLKPTLSHLWQRVYHNKLAFVRTPAELIERGRHARQHGLEFMLQEYIPATDDEIYGLFVVMDRQSQPLGWCVSRKLRQHEPRFGNSCMSECVDEPRVVELGLRLVQAMGFHGIGSAEFKRDPRDGEFKLMEFNVRPTLLMALAVDSGVDVPMLAYRDLIGEAPPAQPVTPVRFGRRVGIFAKDVQVARFHRYVCGLSRLAWLRSWIGARDTHFAWDDLGPFRGYMHGLIDNWRRGKFRRIPPGFPTLDEWQAGEWDGRPIMNGATSPSLAPPASDAAPVASPGPFAAAT